MSARTEQAKAPDAAAPQLVQLVQTASAELERAELAVKSASETLEAQQLTLLAANDQPGLSRLRKALRDAKAAHDGAQDTFNSVQRAHAAAVRAEEQEALEQRWREARALGQQLTFEVQSLRAMLDSAVEQFFRVNELREKLVESLPWRPATAEFTSPLWSAPAFANLTQIQLYMASDGKLLAGRFAMSPWQLKLGPDIVARFRENITRAMSHGPAVRPPDLLPAA